MLTHKEDTGLRHSFSDILEEVEALMRKSLRDPLFKGKEKVGIYEEYKKLKRLKNKRRYTDGPTSRRRLYRCK